MVKFAAILIGLTLALSAQAAPKKTGTIIGSKTLMSYAEFKRLPPKVQKKYLAEVQRVFAEWEMAMARFYPVVENKIRIPLFFEVAEAGWQGEKCFVGGIDTGLVGGKCPTRISRCEDSKGIADSFKCGAIFGSVCIPRNDIKDLSLRCYNEAKKQGVKPAKEVLDAAEEKKKEICAGSNADIDGCQILIRQWTEATDAAKREAAAPTPAPGGSTGSTTGPAGPGTGRPARTDDPNDPAVRDATTPASDTSCYESPDSKKCTDGAVTLNSYNGVLNIFQCGKYDANQPEGYRYRAKAQEFRRFITENKDDPIVKDGLRAWGNTPETAIEGLTGILGRGETHFEFEIKLTPQTIPAAKAMLELYNKKGGFCANILKNRAETESGDTRNAARKPLNLDELKNMAEWNEDYKQKFVDACKTTDKAPQTKAAQLFYKEGNPPVEKAIELGFPMKAKTETEGIHSGYLAVTFRKGKDDKTYYLKKNPQDGTYVYHKEEISDDPGDYGSEVFYDYPIEFRSVHRDEVNFNRVPANATGPSTCDSFRDPASLGGTPGTTSQGQQ